MSEAIVRERRPFPLWARVLTGVAVGAALGVAFGNRPWLFGYGNEDLGQVGLLVIRLLKTLATPLILVAILDSFLATRLRARAGGKLILICLVNVTVAMTIGLLILNTFQPGRSWSGHAARMSEEVSSTAPSAAAPKPAATASLDPLKNLAGYVPESVVDPFLRNNVITVVLLAILLGAALRALKDRDAAGLAGAAGEGVRVLERAIAALYQVLVQALTWVIQAIPFAVTVIVAQVVGKAGLGVFGSLAVYLATVVAGLSIHALLYYPAVAWIVGRKSPRVYVGRGADAIVTGLSCNSSLATVPITLRCLRDMKVSDASARLSACVGTNLNNDGITLYEAMTVIFLCQAFGFDLSLAQQVAIVLASIMAGVGIAGVPEAGLIVLPLVLTAAGFPEATIALAIPLIVPVDWIIARVRSGVNVMADMLVAILLDVGRPPADEDAPAACP